MFLCNVRFWQILIAKLAQVGGNMASSPDSSSDSSTGSPQHPYEGSNIEAENSLPGVVRNIFSVLSNLSVKYVRKCHNQIAISFAVVLWYGCAEISAFFAWEWFFFSCERVEFSDCEEDCVNKNWLCWVWSALAWSHYHGWFCDTK